MTAKLSNIQADVVARVRAAGGRIERWPGGFWTTPGMTKNLRGIPEWYVTTNTIVALERRGVLRESKLQPVRLGKFVVEYALTEAASC